MPAANRPDPALCPLCGQPNTCAIEAGLPPESCWCMHTPVSREALAQLPAEQRGMACLCPACARPVAHPAQEGGPQPI